MRTCSRTACTSPAVATMTFVYADSTAVLGPLSFDVEPGAYDLCPRHAERTSTPKGWNIVRLPLDGAAVAAPTPSDDLMALADAVRAIGFREDDPALRPSCAVPAPEHPTTERGGHLRLVPVQE